MNAATTALILVGFQHDYFADAGKLAGFLEDTSGCSRVVSNADRLLQTLAPTPATLIATPIRFTAGYSELLNPSGILAAIRDAGAFCESPGADLLPMITAAGDRLIVLPGKRGLNAFSNTALYSTLKARGITDVVLAGAVTAICIDSTGREAYERGFKVHIVSDCTIGRTVVEQTFYIEHIFPLYANTLTTADLILSMQAEGS